MQIPIVASKQMDMKLTKNLRERRVIRMPKELRELSGFELGDFLNVRTASGQLIALTVEMACQDDAKNNPSAAYVISELFEALTGTGSEDCEVELVDSVTLGTDPEVVLVDQTNSRIANASRYFCKYDNVGSDGPLLEFRPLPSTDEEVVVANIYALIQAARHRLDHSKWRGNRLFWMMAKSNCHAVIERLEPMGKQHLTTGFHLHYGLPAEVLGWSRRFVAKQVVKAIDYYVGIPSIVPEGNDDNYRRTNPFLAYGKPGNYRLDDRTLEYRVPGGRLMIHPILARGILGLGAVVVEDIISRVRAVTKDFTDLSVVSSDKHIREIYPNIPPMNTIFNTICSPTTAAAKGFLNKIYKDLENMVGFERRSAVINQFLTNLETPFGVNLEENWRCYYGQRQSG